MKNSKRKPSISLILSINLIFCALTSHASSHPHNYNYNPPFPPSMNPPFPPTMNPPFPPSPPTIPSPPIIPTPPTIPSPPMNPTCPRDALQLLACTNVLGGLINIIIGNPSLQPCCSLIAGLIDLEAAICLCTAIRASVLGINLNINLAITLLLNVCGGNFPSGFVCPAN